LMAKLVQLVTAELLGVGAPDSGRTSGHLPACSYAALLVGFPVVQPDGLCPRSPHLELCLEAVFIKDEACRPDYVAALADEDRAGPRGRLVLGLTGSQVSQLLPCSRLSLLFTQKALLSPTSP